MSSWIRIIFPRSLLNSQSNHRLRCMPPNSNRLSPCFLLTSTQDCVSYGTLYDMLSNQKLLFPLLVWVSCHAFSFQLWHPSIYTYVRYFLNHFFLNIFITIETPSVPPQFQYRDELQLQLWVIVSLQPFGQREVGRGQRDQSCVLWISLQHLLFIYTPSLSPSVFLIVQKSTAHRINDCVLLFLFSNQFLIQFLD